MKFPAVPRYLVWVCASLAFVLGCGRVQAASQLGPFMPLSEDFTLLWWANGPQKFHDMKTPTPEAVLCLQSGTLGLALDTKTVQLLHAGRFARSQSTEKALRPANDANNAIFSLPPVALELSVRRGDRKFTCAGRGELPKDDFYFPVRFIASGRFLQRVDFRQIGTHGRQSSRRSTAECAAAGGAGVVRPEES
jgi:hypothetical protein